MSLKHNIFSNYVSQVYITLVSILLVPVYLKYMGAEAFGLVGFFAMLQAWFNLLDLGLSPTVARQTACFRGGGLDAISFCRLIRALERIFFAIALCGGGVLFFASGVISSRWLKVNQLPFDQVELSLQMMAVSVAFRWMCGFYRGQLSGSEKLVFLSGYNALFATLRFVGVLGVFRLLGTAPATFFGYQLLVAFVELIGLSHFAYKLLPALPVNLRVDWDWAPIKPLISFSLSIAFTSAVWIIVTQTDKLVLSKILPLSEYGYFSLAVLVANGIMIVSGPVSVAIMPRLARLHTEGNHDGMIQVYRQATRLVTIISVATAVTLALFAREFLWAWTGDVALSEYAAPVLRLYAIGNGVLAVSAFPYYLQYAKGNLRMHLIGNAGFLIFLIPSVIWAARTFGGVGAGWAWLVMNLIYLVAWVPLVHRKLEPGLHQTWFFRDIAGPASAITVAGLVTSQHMIHTPSRVLQIGFLFGAGLFILLMGALTASEFRTKAGRYLLPRRRGGAI